MQARFSTRVVAGALVSAALLAGCSSGPVRRVSEPSALIQQLTVRADGRWSVDLRIDPKTGSVYPDKMASRLSEDDVRAALAAAGYVQVRDVEFDDGLWHAHAENASGKDIKVQVDPDSGKVVAAEKD